LIRRFEFKDFEETRREIDGYIGFYNLRTLSLRKGKRGKLPLFGFC